MSVTPQLYERKEDLSLRQAAEYLLDECRMVLPGIQALFGFQLIAVFNERFASDLSDGEQILHLAAIGLIALAIGLIMTPAAYHRQAGAQAVSDTFSVCPPGCCYGACCRYRPASASTST